MQMLPETILTAIGRMTVAATDLEHLLAWIGADRAGGDADAVFRQPGQPLTAARGSVQFAAASCREDLVVLVEAAGTQLAVAQATLRRLWRDDSSADPAVFDEVARRLVSCRELLHTAVEAGVGVTLR